MEEFNEEQASEDISNVLARQRQQEVNIFEELGIE